MIVNYNAIVDYTRRISIIFERLFVDMTVTRVLLIFILAGPALQPPLTSLTQVKGFDLLK